MGRPKTIEDGEKTNLYLPLKVKQFLFGEATDAGKSMSAVVVDWAKARMRRTKKKPSTT